MHHDNSGDYFRSLSLEYARGYAPAPFKSPSKKRSRIKSKRRRGKKRIVFASYEVYLSSRCWSNFRKFIFAKRGRKCQRCGATKGEMHVHHLHYRNLGHENPGDVMVLCGDCHFLEHADKHIGPEREDVIRALMEGGDPVSLGQNL